MSIKLSEHAIELLFKPGSESLHAMKCLIQFPSFLRIGVNKIKEIMFESIYFFLIKSYRKILAIC